MNITKYEGGHFGDSAEGMVLRGARFCASGEVRFPPPEFVHGDDVVDPISLGATGRVYTFTTVHPGKAPAYSLAMVDFDFGLRAFGRLVWQGEVAPAIGDVVRVVPFTLPDLASDYAFEPLIGDAA
ncbi:Zn-ribbon domain-containing OB-fold protein [Cupriavidus sp. PET2-C1]